MRDVDSKKLPKIVLRLLAKTRTPFTITINGSCPDVYNNHHGVIYCVNHTNSFDIPITLQACNRHPIVLMGKQRLTPSERLFFFP